MTRANTSLVLFEQVVEGKVQTAGRPFIWDLPAPGPGRPLAPVSELRVTAMITRGSSRCTLGASWSRGASGFDVEIRDPDGAPVASTKVRRVRGSRPYAFDVVKEPKPGPWTVQVTGSNLQDIRFRFFGFEVNSEVWMEAYPSRYRVDPGEEVELRARLFVPHPAQGAKVTAWIGRPGQDWTQLRLEEGLEIGHGPGTAVYRATWKTPERIRGTYLVAVDAVVEKDTDFQVALESKEWKTKGTVQVPRTRRRRLFSFVADDRVPAVDLPVRGMNTRRAWWHPQQRDLLRTWRSKHKDS
jgi:hypothetical protein